MFCGSFLACRDGAVRFPYTFPAGMVPKQVKKGLINLAEKYRAPRGTHDILPKESAKWQYIETTALSVARIFGFSEIRVPTFEHTELFTRSVGDTTDVVQKEMYTFSDKGGRSLTLRPEGTAGVVRSAVENGLLAEALPLKVCYITSCFRYEKPQSGRLREFHQFGVEMFGAPQPSADAQVIMLAHSLLQQLGVTGTELHLNSIGCPDCRAEYHRELKQYFTARLDDLCETCHERLEKNPMRILDCKSPVCHEISAGAPKMLDYLCDDCKEHFEGVKSYLEDCGVPFAVDPDIVRGLDYYTRTVFEFVSSAAGAQGTVCGGGRYDGLVSELGGPVTPALGFGMGLERLLMVMEKTEAPFPEGIPCDLFLASFGKKGEQMAFRLAASLRNKGFWVETDTVGRSLKAQMKYADKLGALYSGVIGDNEVETGTITVKNMTTKREAVLRMDQVNDDFYKVLLDDSMEDLTESAGGTIKI